MGSKVQASEVSYELRSLGWKAFQDLCATTIAEVLGQTVQVFLPSRDGGRDGAFHGTWNPGDGAGVAGSFTVQCKFTTKDSNLAAAELGDELVKAHRLASRGLASNYVLMTNFGVSGVAEEEIRTKFLGIEGINHFLLFGRDWITLKIRESARLRMLVPRVYGLGDLSQILDERAYAQAEDILSALGDNLSKFVVTEAYTRAARALVRHGFVLLLGEPAAGKSTIAASLAMGALDIWGCSTLKIRNADEFVAHWNPHEPRQFFWVDDTFGTTQYQRDLASDWNRVFPHMNAAIRKGARVLFTSRDYIYRAARFDLKVGAFPLINESQVVINVQRLSLQEKEQILYNHIKLGEQPSIFRKRIKTFLPQIAANPHFLPEIARRLGNPIFAKQLKFESDAVRKFVEKPIEFLIEIVTNLDAASRAALALIFMRGGVLESPISLTKQEEEAFTLLGVGLPAAREALVSLNASLVSLVHSGGRITWTFKHPTIGDAYANIVAQDPELLDIYLSWTSADKLITEVTCGTIGLEGVKVIVPQSRFTRFAERLREIKSNRVFTFLASRCSPEFLTLFLKQNPDLANTLTQPDPYISASPEVHLLAKLHQVGLLPEEWRTRFVKHAEKLALQTPELDFISIERIRSLFTEADLDRLFTRVREELLPNLHAIIGDLQSECDKNEDPEEHFAPLDEVLHVVRQQFKGDLRVEELLNAAREEIDEAIRSLQEESWHEEPDYDYEGGSRMESSGERSVFDDIDK